VPPSGQVPEYRQVRVEKREKFPHPLPLGAQLSESAGETRIAPGQKDSRRRGFGNNPWRLCGPVPSKTGVSAISGRGLLIGWKYLTKG
jgi:hypothetical protein